jgi:hypothetical protein
LRLKLKDFADPQSISYPEDIIPPQSSGTTFDHNSENLALVMEKLNHRPRKCLGYQSPHKVLWKAANGALAT